METLNVNTQEEQSNLENAYQNDQETSNSYDEPGDAATGDDDLDDDTSSLDDDAADTDDDLLDDDDDFADDDDSFEDPDLSDDEEATDNTVTNS